MFRFGADFKAARAGATYNAVNGQGWLWVLLFLILQVAVYMFAQSLAMLLAHYFLYGDLPRAPEVDPNSLAKTTKAGVVGMLPAAVLAGLFSWQCSNWLNKTGERGIPLRWPDLGFGGWVVTLGGVVVFLNIVFVLTYAVLGIDPTTYAPTANGVNDTKSMSGLVEKTVADLVNEPWLLALALPGIIIGAPLCEELIFRGALFAKLRNSWFGQTGAVVITAVLWSAIHIISAPLLFVSVIFIMGLMQGWLLLRFGSLWVNLAAHAVWNAFTSIAIFSSVSGS